jgi:hypothetical protein
MSGLKVGIGLLMLAILVLACDEQMPQSPDAAEKSSVIEKSGSSGIAAATSHKFVTEMTGAENVPPIQTGAMGDVRLKQNNDGTEMTFTVLVRELSDITLSHIHLGPVGVNGDIVVTFYDGPTIPGPFTGVLAEGTITAADLEGPLAGQPLSALVALINADSAYVNVHSVTYPSGEIRGQVVPYVE